MILGAEIGLDTLAIGGTAAEDVLTRLVTADEADGLDGRLVKDEVDSAVSAVDDVNNTLGEASLLDQLGQDHGRARVTFGGLEDKGVAGDGGDRNAPERDHGREV